MNTLAAFRAAAEARQEKGAGVERALSPAGFPYITWMFEGRSSVPLKVNGTHNGNRGD